MNEINPAPVSRPGITTAALARAGVRHVDADAARSAVGYSAAGLLIPYRRADGEDLVVNGRAFARLRVTQPGDGPRYLSPAKSGCQCYIPPELNDLLRPGQDIVLIEGEFKALSLVESGVPAVGIGGISSACPKGPDGAPELLPAIRELIEKHRPARILFVGDSDTAMINGFAREAVKLARTSGLPVGLPRIAADSPGKAPDDLREQLGIEGFRAHWWRLVAEAEPVTAGTDPAALQIRLLRRERDAIAKLAGDPRDEAESRLVKLAARTDDVALVAEVEATFDRLGIVRRVVIARVKSQREKELSAREQALVDRVKKATAPDGDAPLFFDGNNYFRRENDNCFGKLARPDALLHFHALGLKRTGNPISPAESALRHVQSENRISFAGPLCGRGTGLVEENGARVLVTRPPVFIEGSPGESPTIDTVVASVFGVHAGDPEAGNQVGLFIGWLKHVRQAMRYPERHIPGLIMGIVGAADCGKSLIQDFVLTPGMGNRTADPALFFTGDTDFNSDLWGAEHLCLSDKTLDVSGGKRDLLKNQLKQIAANQYHHLHRKGLEGITLRPIWRVTLTANDDPDSATVLPTLDDGFADKIVYFKAHSPTQPFYDESDPVAREAFAQRLRDELPHFLHAVDHAVIPPELVGNRFGVKAWHHPDVVELIEVGDASQPLIEVLEKWVDSWSVGEDERKIQTGDLYSALEDITKGNLARRKIASGVSHLGHELRRIARSPAWKGRLESVDFRVNGRVENKKRRGWLFRKSSK